ncbi:hypothetical protein YA0089_24925 [Pseudomonas viridiflava]|uniref:hypothetical protein n=1 Tax=Pseudomonas viridiflava TaxID=33069 RepID=UPI0018E63C52|nr:hypothetical protein [Pseudomonas viridiflava]MBI6726859.1 hypothetical protein [Pseudomonas viridiflava]
MKSKNINGIPCLVVKADCGFTFAVPIEKIWQDFKQCVIQMENVSADEAHEIIEQRKIDDPDHWQSWFREQYTWDDVEADGFITESPKPDQVRAMARSYRTGGPADDLS